MFSYNTPYHKTGFGIADKLSDYHTVLAVICGVVFAGSMIYICPKGWIGWLIMAPLVGIFAALVLWRIIGGLEYLIYSMVYPKRVFTKNWLKGFLLLFSIIAVLVLSAILAGYTSNKFTKEDSSEWEAAYISESPRATKYHYDEECRYLKRSPFILDYTVEEAEKYHYEPCKLCLEAERTERADVYSFLLWIGFSVGLFTVGNRLQKVIRKRKFIKEKPV